MISDADKELTELLHSSRALLKDRDPSAIDPIEKAYAIALQKKDREHLGQILMDFSNYYSIVKKDFDKFQHYTTESKQYLDLSDPRKAAMYYGNLGINYHFFYRLPEAHDNYLKAIQNMEQVPDITESETNRLATIYYNLYILFSFTELAALDRRYLNKAMELYESTNHTRGIVFCYGAIINDLDKQGKTEEALEYALKRLKLSEEIKDDAQIGFSASTTGLLYAKLNDRKRSQEYFAKAESILLHMNIVQNSSSLYDEQGQAYLALGDYDKSIQLFHQALDLYLSIDSTLNLSKLYKQMSEAYEKAGRYKEALDFQQRYAHTLLDNFKTDKIMYMSAAQSEFERKHQEQETKMLKQKNDEISLYVKQLEQTNEELKQFAHAASHDLREPVRMIVSYSELLEMSAKNVLNDEQKEFISYLREGGKRINDMLAGILAFSKVTNQHEEMMVSTDLNDTLRMVTETHSITLANRKATIHSVKLPSVKSNPILMMQLFQNLISNGIKYNESERPEIKISCEREGDFYRFCISDNGIGISDQYRDKVFDIFTRLHNRKDYPGSGIGLSICKKIVERMGGRIWSQSNSSGGTDFLFTLPA